MRIYQALTDVHFRLSDEGRMIRCCGKCGAEAGMGATDPCPDIAACRQRAATHFAIREVREVVSLECGVN